MTYQERHDSLADRYYNQGNPDQLTPGQFIRQHDLIWVEMAEAGGIEPSRAAEMRQDVDARAILADIAHDADAVGNLEIVDQGEGVTIILAGESAADL